MLFKLPHQIRCTLPPLAWEVQFIGEEGMSSEMVYCTNCRVILENNQRHLSPTLRTHGDVITALYMSSGFLTRFV